MDGFEKTLRTGLQKATGDIKIISRSGFFDLDSKLNEILKSDEIKEYTSILQTEGFFMKEGKTKGVLFKGIEPKTFSKVTGLELKSIANKMVIGKELAKEMRLKIGDSAVLAFGKGNKGIISLPLLVRLEISDIIEHGIYDKDFCFFYLRRDELQGFLQLKENLNLLLIKLNDSSADNIEKVQGQIREKLEFPFLIRPFWNEFASLLEAVQIEKLSITLILQLIVVISIFNIAAFIIFISEKKAQDFFLFQALGMNPKSLFSFWVYLVFFIWALSCFTSVALTYLFDNVLLKLPFLQIPGQIYVLGKLSLSLQASDYLIVFLLSLLWVFLVTSFGFLRLRKKSILYGLRKEFN